MALINPRQIRFRISIPEKSYNKLKELKEMYNLNYGQIAQIIVVKALEQKDLDL